MAKKSDSSAQGKGTAPKKMFAQPQPAYTPDGSVANPDAVVDTTDPGDDTQSRFRYQHAYGVILLIGAARNLLPYQSIWCEQHDDFLARCNGTFHSFQVKTAKPELGAWDLGRDGLLDAFQKFTTLEQRFPNKMSSFSFVSNVSPLDSNAKDKVHRSPFRLRDAINGKSAASEVLAPFDTVLSELATRFSVTPELVFTVLQKVKYVQGPSLDDFEAVLSSNHVGSHPDCHNLTLTEIHVIRDELIQKVFACSSCSVSDPAKHWCCVDGDGKDHPWLLAKEIPVSVVADIIRTKHPLPFRFSPAPSLIHARRERNALTVLEKKLVRGGLTDQLETMRRRTVSAERHLLALAAKDSVKAQEVQNQLETFVKGVCDDASLRTRATAESYGPAMLSEVQDHLRNTAQRKSDLIFGQEYECLVGMAGLLTEACAVWWSSPFDIGEEIQ